MKCPVDGNELKMTERSGVEIDYCPQCRGVWLDRGELDKIIERSAPEVAPQPAAPQQPAPGGYPPQPGPGGYQGGHGGHYPYKKKKKSFLDDLFDF